MAENVEERVFLDNIDPAAQDRLENFLSALFELKYNISNIEKKYPFLGSELSSLCDQALSQLSDIAAGKDQSTPGQSDEVQEIIAENTNPKSQEISPECPFPSQIFSSVEETTRAHRVCRRTNPFVYWLDLTGGYLVTALDRMGDFIISIMEKILSVEPETGEKRPKRENQTGQSMVSM